jgi:hypothetical protein
MAGAPNAEERAAAAPPHGFAGQRGLGMSLGGRRTTMAVAAIDLASTETRKSHVVPNAARERDA